MDLEKANDTIDKADGFLTKLKNLLKKHWGILLIILICFGIYKFCVLVGEEMDKPTEQPTEQVQQPTIDTSLYYEEDTTSGEYQNNQ